MSTMSDFRGHEKTIKSLLHQKGLRLTRQRQKILNLFNSNGENRHLSAEEIHRQLGLKGENISPSTIYRMLHVMVNLGLLREFELAEDKKIYELHQPYSSHHHHLVCVQCGDVVEFQENMMSQVGCSQAETQGFALLDCQFTVYGICPLCQGRQTP